MDKKVVLIKLHSLVDLITNSSTELFIIDTSKTEGILKEIFDVIKKNPAEETNIQKWEDYKYKSDLVIQEDADLSNVYVCRIDQNDVTLMAIIKKFFTQIKFKYAE